MLPKAHLKGIKDVSCFELGDFLIMCKLLKNLGEKSKKKKSNLRDHGKVIVKVAMR